MRLALHVVLIVLLGGLGFGGTMARAQPYIVKKQRIRDIITTHLFHNKVQIIDSTHYVYSGKRGSRFKAFDHFGGSVFGYRNYYYPESYDLALLPDPLYDAHSLSVNYDTCVRFLLYSSLGLVNIQHEHMVAVYDDHNRITLFLENYYRLSGQRRGKAIAYNAQGHMEHVYALQFDSSLNIVDTLSSREVVCDDMGRVVSDTIRHNIATGYDMTTQTYYNADGTVRQLLQSQGAGTASEQLSRRDLQYNDEGKLTNEILCYFNKPQNTWDSAYALFVTYDELGRMNYYENTETSTWGSSYYKCSLRYNAWDGVDTLVRTGHMWQLQEYIVLYYNEYHNPYESYTYRVFENGKIDSISYRTKYYYEEYTDTLPAPPQIIPEDIVIYPNPARNTLAIRWNDKLPNTGVFIRLYSNNGQLARQLYLPAIEKENTISIQGLSSGVYYLRIATAGGGILHTAAISISNGES